MPAGGNFFSSRSILTITSAFACEPTSIVCLPLINGDGLRLLIEAEDRLAVLRDFV